jgi:NifU-like protein
MAGAPSCGAIVRLSIEIEPANHTIRSAKFQSSGCGYAVAAASLLTEVLIGISVPEAASLLAVDGGWERLVNDHLGDFPVNRNHCSALARDALAAALTDHQMVFREHSPLDEALICTCFFVSERTIEDAIRTNGLTTTDQVTRTCRAGGGCGACHSLIAELIDAAHRQVLETNHDLFG